jgi:hypothetical protein
MATKRQDAEAASKRKAIMTGVVGAASVTAGVVIAWPLAVVGAIPTAVLGWGWWRHRVEHGLKL